MKKEKVLKDIYKYYSMNLEREEIDVIESRRKKKIERKKGLEGKKLLQDIINIAKNYEVVDWTDSESCCYEYKILLSRNQSILDDDKELMRELNGLRKDLRIFISSLESYYYMFVEETKYIETTNNWLFNVLKNYDEEVEELLRKINRYFLAKGYSELLDADVKMIVPGVQTELTELNTAKVFDCLFTDLVSIF